MNRYGALAKEHWEKYAPSRVAALEDPEGFFTDLGEQIEAQVQAIALQLETSSPAQDEYLDRVAQLNGFRRQAEEIVLAETVYSVETEHASANEELTDIVFDLPSAGSMRVKIQELLEKQEEWGELEPTEKLELEQAQALLPLIDFPEGPNAAIDRMSEAEMRDLILALTPFWDPDEHYLRRV